jgi:uncharacterized membrane protein
VGAGVPGVIAIISHGAPSGTTEEWWFILLAGASYAIGSGLMALALKIGNVSVVMPIIACDGGIGAVLATLTGSTLAGGEALLLTMMVLGVVIVASSSSQAAVGGATEVGLRPILVAAGSAAGFGVVFLAAGKANGMDSLWVTALSRALPIVIALAICLKLRAVLPPRGAWPFLIAYGLADGLGYLSYVEGSQYSIPVAAVAASQYAALAVVGGILVYGERLSGQQAVGTAAIIVAATVLAAVGA